MVNVPNPQDSGADHVYDEIVERWQADRPSRRRKARDKRRAQGKRVSVRSHKREQPNVARMSRALLEAHRELMEAQAESDAQVEDGEAH